MKPLRKAIVFDLDGTLIDSAPDLHAALNRLLEAAGLAALTLDDVKTMIGDGVKVLVGKAFSAAGMSLGDDELAAKCEDFLEDYEGNGAVLTRPYPHVAETLNRLQDDGLSLAVCTNKPEKATLGILDELGLGGFFDVVVGGDSLDGVRKPDPRPLLAVLERLGVEPDEAVMVGDSENDVAAADGADVPVIAVSYGYAKRPPAALGAALVIDGLGELPQALRRLP